MTEQEIKEAVDALYKEMTETIAKWKTVPMEYAVNDYRQNYAEEV